MEKNNIITPAKALLRTQALCARQERCSHDIRLKLIQWKQLNNNIEKIIKQLINDGFINDERYAKMFVRDKSKFNKWGSNKIRYSLKSKHLSEEIIITAMNEIDHSNDESSIKELIERKIKGIKSKSIYDLKTKLIRFGLSRGFDYETVNNAVSQILKDALE